MTNFGGLVSGGGQGGHGPSKIFVEVAAWSNVGYNYIFFFSRFSMGIVTSLANKGLANKG